ncbi:unnamed protein product [Rhizophagus irregularis]|uniref:HTH myb-type domain-containing protein n=1 Tax=Rhizophagus irregularis TaxID=588596 RepID=A0A2I1H0T0_9GLOM|nr:hypothetical protein RhiirA4_496821 [Rhizophagus irregularis]CAB4408126.1 unnamed protein product [Rhizophagus irregularis]
MNKPKKRQSRKQRSKKIETKKIELIDNEIISAMNEYKAMPNCYVMISKKINKGFSPKQIRQRWISQLDPRLCQWPLDNNEKFYIIHWVEGYKIKNPSKNINWKELIFEMEKKFGKFRSESKVKNYYSSTLKQRRKRQLPSNDNVFNQNNNVPTTVLPSPQDINVPKGYLHDIDFPIIKGSDRIKIQNLLN